MAIDPIMDGNICTGVITESKGGTAFYPCRVLIDTTGDCDVLRRCGIPTVSGENFFTFSAKMVTLNSCKQAIESNDIRNIYKNINGGKVNLFGDNQPDDIPRWSGLSAEDVTDYIVRNHLLILKELKNTDRTTREIVTTPGMPQFRTTAHIKGDYSLKVEDAYRHFDDSICAINDFEHRDHLFEIPLRSLTRKDFPNIITAGRSADGTGYGWDLIRVIPPAILTGQAAGEVACLAIKTNVDIANVDIRALQAKLEQECAHLYLISKNNKKLDHIGQAFFVSMLASTPTQFEIDFVRTVSNRPFLYHLNYPTNNPINHTCDSAIDNNWTCDFKHISTYT